MRVVFVSFAMIALYHTSLRFSAKPPKMLQLCVLCATATKVVTSHLLGVVVVPPVAHMPPYHTRGYPAQSWHAPCASEIDAGRIERPPSLDGVPASRLRRSPSSRSTEDGGRIASATKRCMSAQVQRLKALFSTFVNTPQSSKLDFCLQLYYCLH